MFVPKQQVLADAMNALNRPGQTWMVTVEGDSIVARWIMNGGGTFDDGTKDYSFTARLDDKGKWHEQDTDQVKESNVKLTGNGISIGSSKNSFKGKTTQKSFEFGAKNNEQTGQTEMGVSVFDTNLVKKPVRDYLTACGWKKAGLFG